MSKYINFVSRVLFEFSEIHNINSYNNIKILQTKKHKLLTLSQEKNYTMKVINLLSTIFVLILSKQPITVSNI